MISKRYKALPQETRKLKNDTIDYLLGIIKKNCTTKFDESIDINFQLNSKQMSRWAAHLNQPPSTPPPSIPPSTKSSLLLI